jgi:hypothetical protein
MQIPFKDVNARPLVKVNPQLSRVAHQQEQLMVSLLNQRFDDVMANAAASASDQNALGTLTQNLSQG